MIDMPAVNSTFLMEFDSYLLFNFCFYESWLLLDILVTFEYTEEISSCLEEQAYLNLIKPQIVELLI